MVKKDPLSGICQCPDCKYKRKKESTKFKCVDCQKVKNGEQFWRGYKGKHGPLCEQCKVSYDGET